MPKRVIKKIIVPFVGPLLRILHIKILGKHVFINKYTRRIPIASPIFKLLDSKVRLARTREERQLEYQKWFRKHYPGKSDIATQAKVQRDFNERPLISLIVPTYNTNIEHLRECIESVINQTYDNWQLCITDDKSTNQGVRKVIEHYAQSDSRISYVFRETNGHICKASNSALELAKGKYIALLDHDDVLWPNALFEVVKLLNKNSDAEFIYSDEDKIDETGNKHLDPFFKPDWSPELLRSINYITHFATIKKSLVEKVGGFRKGYEGAQDWDLFLRVSRETDKIYHIPTVLYSWRMSETSTAQAPSSKDYAYINQKKALDDDIKARGYEATISWQIPLSMWRVDYKLKKKPLVSIIIPTKDQYDLINKCLNSIHSNTTYNNYEVVIVDTGSTDSRVWELYNSIKQKGCPVRVVGWDKKFNFSATCNYGAENARGDYLLFLNNDTEVITDSWVEDMLGYAQQPGIGAVGVRLYYPDRKIQHAGIILGVGGQNGTPGIAGHFFPAFIDNPPQDPAQQTYIGGTRDFAAVTAACLMVSQEKFAQVKGFDEKLRIAFNDVDFCLKLLTTGYRNVYLPHVQLFHHESISIGKPGSKERDLHEFAKEIGLMMKKWKRLIENDPYYHPEFRRDVASARLNI